MSSKRVFASSPAIDLYGALPTEFPRAVTTSNTTPATELQALMEAMPHIEPAVAATDEVLLREVLAAVYDMLPPLEQYVIESLIIEGLSLRQAAHRFGRSKSTVSRIRDDALKTMRSFIEQEIVMTPQMFTQKPNDWREAAYDQLAVVNGERIEVAFPVAQVVDAIDFANDYYDARKFRRADDEVLRAGRIAWQWLLENYEEDEQELFRQQLDLLCERQAKYGHKNILKRLEAGILIRMSDKAARLENMEDERRDFADDSVVDAWMDIVGYTVIYLMLDADTFTLDLKL